MAKNVVFLADGTWNGPGQDDEEPQTTNVFKLFTLLAGSDDIDSLALAKEQERRLASNGAVEQVAKYLHGVGDSRNAIVRMLGGAFGAGVIARIVRGYTFVSRNFAAGDRIFIVGFSRGAYTARSLGGLIAAKGLLDPADCADKERAYRIGCALWAQYRSERRSDDSSTRSKLHAILSNLPSFADPDSKREEKPTHPLRPATIACIGVWDTVGSLGIPLYDSSDQRLDVFKFCDCDLSPTVSKGYHAVAVSERRADFTPTLWNPRQGIEQVLFAGAHADVGGGHPITRDESGLAHVSLHWMCDSLAREGVALRTDSRPSDLFPGSPFGPSHQPWTEFPWTLARSEARDFSRRPDLQPHPSMTARLVKREPYVVFPSGRSELFVV